MPDMPIYQAKRNINVKQAAPLMGKEEASAPMGQVVDTMAAITQKWSDAHDVMQYTEANAAYNVGVADIQARAAADPDYKDSDKYYKELDKLKQESVKGIGNQEVANKAFLEFDYGNKIAGIKIDAQFKRKELEYNRSVLGSSVKGAYQKIFDPSLTQAEKSQEELNINLLLTAHVEQGTITELEKDAMVESAIESAASFEAEYYPESFLQNKGQYPLSKEKKMELSKVASNMKKKINAEDIKAKNEVRRANSIEITKTLFGEGNPLSSGDISQMIGNDEISSEFGKAYINAITSPSLTEQDVVEDKTGFTSFIYEIFDSENHDAIIASITNVLNGGADGRLNQNQMNVLLQVAVQKNEELNRGDSWIEKFGKAVGKKKDALFDYASALIGGKEPEEAKKEAVEKDQIRSNPNRTKYSIGDLVQTPLGPMYVWGYFEDGEPDVRPEKPKQ